MRFHKGFTLVELMIALALGLIIVAAAVMLFITGQQNYFMQRGAADIQDNSNFGLSYIAKNIRLANLNTTTAVVDDTKLYGGILLSIKNVPSTIPQATLTALLSAANAHASNVQSGSTEVDLKSDQLTIQYLPVRTGGFDCEGQAITTTNRVIVERYFLREDSHAATGEPNSPLALACDAGSYTLNSPTEITGLADTNNGQIIMKRVDYFRVLLLVQSSTGLRYMPINTYMSITTTPKPRILAVQLGLLVRASDSAGQSAQLDDEKTFNILDQSVKAKIPATATTKYIRQPLMQTITLRNALGDR